jgi:hypothetical protein
MLSQLLTCSAPWRLHVLLPWQHLLLLLLLLLQIQSLLKAL